MRYVWKLVLVFVAVLSLMLAGAGVPRHFVAHAAGVSSRHAATPFCSDEGCDKKFEDGGTTNCSVNETNPKTDDLYSGGTMIGYVHLFVSDPGPYGCASYWAGVDFVGISGCESFSTTYAVGNYNTKEYSQSSEFPGECGGNSYWDNSVMDGVARDTCFSVWVQGFVLQAGQQFNFDHKLIYGGAGC